MVVAGLTTYIVSFCGLVSLSFFLSFVFGRSLIEQRPFHKQGVWKKEGVPIVNDAKRAYYNVGSRMGSCRTR